MLDKVGDIDTIQQQQNTPGSQDEQNRQHISMPQAVDDQHAQDRKMTSNANDTETPTSSEDSGEEIMQDKEVNDTQKAQVERDKMMDEAMGPTRDKDTERTDQVLVSDWVDSDEEVEEGQNLQNTDSNTQITNESEESNPETEDTWVRKEAENKGFLIRTEEDTDENNSEYLVNEVVMRDDITMTTCTNQSKDNMTEKLTKGTVTGSVPNTEPSMDEENPQEALKNEEAKKFLASCKMVDLPEEQPKKRTRRNAVQDGRTVADRAMERASRRNDLSGLQKDEERKKQVRNGVRFMQRRAKEVMQGGSSSRMMVPFTQ